jgi:hypothetical protein
VLGVMLSGIVAMQVEVLKLNASMGRSIALASSLQTRNELLRTSVSSLSDAHRIERLASRMGMVMPGPTSVDFLHGQANTGRAVAGIHAPDATAFDSVLQASALQAAAATTPASTTATPAATTATTPSSATATTPTSSVTTTPATAATSTPTTGTTPNTGATGVTGPAATTPSTTSSTLNTGGAAPAG